MIRFIEVDPKTKRTLGDGGADYRQIYPLGLVPLLRLDDGSLLSENAAILQYIAAAIPKQSWRRPTTLDGRACSNGCASSAPNCTRGCSFRCSIKRHRKARGRTR